MDSSQLYHISDNVEIFVFLWEHGRALTLSVPITCLAQEPCSLAHTCPAPNAPVILTPSQRCLLPPSLCTCSSPHPECLSFPHFLLVALTPLPPHWTLQGRKYHTHLSVPSSWVPTQRLSYSFTLFPFLLYEGAEPKKCLAKYPRTGEEGCTLTP